ncbi:MAG: ATP-dependent sacrificial sulfur transferase LarE [Planctomycetota bacterium]|nr:ATP-dependent sacrificial sulfur transferase LarE [Planctomycetota bacterium]MDA1248416.1 ATP-dependent sacrificial sulfur transferase LarE [Planctomycetota bacterium]
MSTTSLPDDLQAKRDQLLELLRQCGRVAVAFSAGVDSTVVAKAAQLACGEKAVAVTASSASLATGELDEAVRLAQLIGIRHRIIETSEFADSNYLSNPSNRCFFCKSELYSQLDQILPELNVDVVVNGANLDDRGDHRPGMIAAGEHSVRSPLIEAGLTKQNVRDLARHWDLPVWDKPAMPCLSSRIAYGVEVTSERVRRIDLAEQFLAELLGTRELRVRLEAGDLARIEVPCELIGRLADPESSKRVAMKFREFGFKFVTLDLEGFRSGSLNSVLPAESLSLPIMHD